ncbi:hypothetical protein D915_007085 [Fasciola hepatica]|uniref:Uncharacterized protein n=1 Tax=Fasciola hepatica TaxID=6192 RepID=A0A4E0RWH3_FASHE|nr:hypothetical protein D915_007085 [Fasciola hepatica]
MLNPKFLQITILVAVFVCFVSAYHLGIVPVEVEQQGYRDFPLWLWYADEVQSGSPFRSLSRNSGQKRANFDQIMFRKRKSTFDPILFR